MRFDEKWALLAVQFLFDDKLLEVQERGCGNPCLPLSCRRQENGQHVDLADRQCSPSVLPVAGAWACSCYDACPGRHSYQGQHRH